MTIWGIVSMTTGSDGFSGSVFCPQAVNIIATNSMVMLTKR
jgi:hypothetical protein